MSSPEPSLPKISSKNKLRRLYEKILQDELKLSLVLSFASVFLFSFLSIYFFFRFYSDSRSHYTLNLETTFFQGITLGTKVRFQASLVVGNVVDIQTDLNKHRILLRLKKDFQIPKEGSSVSIATWGYFGAKFININTYQGGSNNIPYSPGDTVTMSSPINPSLTMQNFQAVLKENKISGDAPLNQKLKSARSMIRRLKKIAYKNNRLNSMNQGGRLIEQTLHAKALLKNLNNYLGEINKELASSRGQIETVIPKLNRAADEFRKRITYRNRLKNFLTRYVYNETDYAEMEIFASATRRKTERLLKNPSLLLGPD